MGDAKLPQSAFDTYDPGPPRNSPRERAEVIPREAQTPKYRPGDWNVKPPSRELADRWLKMFFHRGPAL